MTLIPRSLQARTAVVIASAFFVFLSLFFVTTYFSIRNSLLTRSDGEVHNELEQIASVLHPNISNDTLAHILSEHQSIGESPLRYVFLELRNGNFIVSTIDSSKSLPRDVVFEIQHHPGKPVSYATSEGDMRLISLAHGNHIIGASYNTIILEESEQSIIQVFAYYLDAGLLVGILGGIFLSKYLIGPITSLATTARTILHHSRHSPARLPVSKTILEVGALARSINELLDAREQAMERQRNFAADAAHELRTPLTVLKGEIEVELRITEKGSPQAELLRSNLEEIDRLISTVQDLLELAEIESEKDQSVEQNECSILSSINYAAEHLRSLAEARGIEFVIPEQDVIIAAQEKRITRLIYNLLLNAIQHSGVSHRVEILLKMTDEGCIVEIEDRGKGIPPERMEHLFERFHPTERSFPQKNGGAGLGLAIVKSIADHYHFKLSVKSGEDTGTTVSVHIPRSAIVG
jgi:signal transduction histidine kinase